MEQLQQTIKHFDYRRIIARAGSLSGTSFLLLIARIVGAVSGVTLQIVIARNYSAEILGNFYLAFGLAAVLSIVLTMGYPWIIAPVVAKSVKERDPGLLKAFLRTANRHLAVTSLVVAMPILAITWVIPSIDGDLRWALILGIITAPVYALMRLNGSLANARKYFAVANLPELMLRPVFLLMFLVATLALAWNITSTLLTAYNLIITVLLAAWVSLVLHLKNKQDQLPALSSESHRSGYNDTENTKNWRKLAIPMIFATLFVNLFADLDILIVGSILPINQAGIFGVCIKITFLMTFAIQIVHQILLRDAADAHSADDQDNLNAIITNANRFAVAITGAGLIFLIIFGPWILGVFGPEFKVGYGCMVGLMIAQLIRACAGPAIQILMICGNQKASQPVYFTSLAVLVASNLLLVPIFGFLGAAAAVIITTLFMTIRLNRVVVQKTAIQVSIFAR